MRRTLIVLIAAATFAGCARSAPELPPDYGSVNPSQTLTADRFSRSELEMSCDSIALEQTSITNEAGQLTGVIQGNRTQNQVAGYFGGLFLFPLVAAKNNPAEKARLDNLQTRWDTLSQLERFKRCPETGTSKP